MGATIVDSLGFLHVLGLNDEFERAKRWVLNDLHPTKPVQVSVFESTIRILGGLLSAHALTNDSSFIAPAEQLGHALLKAFKPDHHLPCKHVHLSTGMCDHKEHGFTTLAAAGTLLMEFRELSRVTKIPDFEMAARRAERAIVESARRRDPPWLLPKMLSTTDAEPRFSDVNIDGGTDSYYEYLAKLWLQGDRTESSMQHVFNDTVAALVDHCFVETAHHAMIGSVTWHSLQRRSDENRLVAVRSEGSHLSCFFPGTLALYGMMSGDTSKIELAERLLYTCWQLYNSTTSGVGAEEFSLSQHEVEINTHAQGRAGLQPPRPMKYRRSITDMVDAECSSDELTVKSSSGYKLRPEVMESIMYMYRATGKEMYREWGWKAFAAWERHLRVASGGYCGVVDVCGPHPRCGRQDGGLQHSFWLGETLKYTWLLFDDGHSLPLTDWVFTTEAHPLPVKKGFPDVLQGADPAWAPEINSSRNSMSQHIVVDGGRSARSRRSIEDIPHPVDSARKGAHMDGLIFVFGVWLLCACLLIGFCYRRLKKRQIQAVGLCNLITWASLLIVTGFVYIMFWGHH